MKTLCTIVLLFLIAAFGVVYAAGVDRVNVHAAKFLRSVVATLSTHTDRLSAAAGEAAVDAGEATHSAVVLTYDHLYGFWHVATTALSDLFSAQIIVVNAPQFAAPTPTFSQIPSPANSAATITNTFVIQGVTEEYLEERIAQVNRTTRTSIIDRRGGRANFDDIEGETLNYDTATLGTVTVSDDASFEDVDATGNVTIDGTLTAGTLSVSGVSSGGEVEAAYFTATSSTASTLPYASSTAITVSGTASTTNLISQTAEIGSMTITTLSVTSTLTAGSATTTNLFSSVLTGNTLAVGGTATTTISTNGLLTVGGNFTFGGDTFDELVGDGFELSSGDLIFDCSDVAGTGLSCSGEDLTLNATGDWTGTLDGIEGASFLRSDASDSYTSGTLTFDAGTVLDLNTTSLSIADTDIAFDGASTNFTFTGNFTANTDDLTIIKATGNVGIGTTSPQAKLHISQGFVRAPNATTDLVLENTSNTGINLLSGSASVGHVLFGDAASAQAGRISYNHADDSLRLWANNVEALSILSSGNVGIGTTSPMAKLAVEGTFTSTATTTLLTSGVGFVGIGDYVSTWVATPPQSPMPSLTVARSVNWAGINFDNIRDLSLISPVENGSAYSSFDNSTIGGGSFDYDHLSGYQDRTRFTGSGTLGSQWSFYSSPTFSSGITTNRFGVRVLDPGGAGTLVNNYGVYIASQTRGTNNYAIYAAGTSLNYFGGNVSIGTTASVFQLDVAGAAGNGIRFTGNNVSTVMGELSSAGFLGTITNNALVFATNSTEKVRITSTGNVGIGTTNPLARFEVDSPTDNGGSSPSAAEAVLNLRREGVSSQSWHNNATLMISRYENVSTNSRTALTFNLGHDSNPAVGAGTNVMTLWSSGNVGIGDTTPTEAELVVGSAGVGNVFLTLSTTGTTNNAVCWDNSGATLLYDCDSTPADYAESYATEDNVEYGDIVMMTDEVVSQKDGDTAPKLARAVEGGSVVGIVSDNYHDFTSAGKDLISSAHHPMPVALNGRVPVKVNDEGGEVKQGDRIALSSDAGVGKKATESGITVGIALEDADNGSVLVFVQNEYYFVPTDAKLVSLLASPLATTTSETRGILAGFFDRVIAWLADSANNIGDVFARVIHTDTICVKKSDGTEFCANGDDLEAMMAGVGASDGGGDTAPPIEEESPVDDGETPPADPPAEEEGSEEVVDDTEGGTPTEDIGGDESGASEEGPTDGGSV